MSKSEFGYQQNVDSKFDTLLEQLRKIVDKNVISPLEYHRAHGIWPRRVFRISGTLVILLSVSIPVLATLEYRGKAIILSTCALLIASLTSMNSFYKWEDSWRRHRQTEFALTNLISIWDVKIIEAMQDKDAEHSMELLLTATKQLLDDARAVLGAEREEHFKNIQWPRVENKLTG